jgi:hypothetical protein
MPQLAFSRGRAHGQQSVHQPPPAARSQSRPHQNAVGCGSPPPPAPASRPRRHVEQPPMLL